MPANKSQHFVPQFYLRLFAPTGSTRTIGLLNIPSLKLVANAPLRSQACRDYFYSQNGEIEKGLGTIESKAAKVLRDVTSSDNLPARHSEDHHWLLLFVLLLQARTIYAADEVNETAEQIGEIVMSLDKRFEGLIGRYRVGFSNPAATSVRNAIELRVLVRDLACKLLFNKTAKPFITSDNPVVCYNQWTEAKEALCPGAGWASKGLQVFLPISPKHCMMYYDAQVYNVGSHRNPVIELSRTIDIDSLNLLQMINASENVYFGDAPPEEELVALAQDSKQQRSKAKSTTTEHSNSENPNSSFYVHTRRDIRCGLELSFAQILKKAKEYSLGNRVVHVRDEGICRLYGEFQAQVEEGKYGPEAFDVFLSEKSHKSQPKKPTS